MATTATVQRRAQIRDVKEYTYLWEGTDRNNRQVRGEMRAASETVVTTTLRRQGIRIAKLRRQSLSKINHRRRRKQTRSQVRPRFGIKSRPPERQRNPRRRDWDQASRLRRLRPILPINPRPSHQLNRPSDPKGKQSRRIEHRRPEVRGASAPILRKRITIGIGSIRVDIMQKSSAGRPMADWLCVYPPAGS